MMQHVYNQSYLDPSELEKALLAMIKDGERIINVTRTTGFIDTFQDRASYLIITETNTHKEKTK